jgi:parvulin-like peptidyl-prolyl isomerase
VKEYEDQLVISRYLGDRVGKNLSITDPDLKAYYQSHITQFASTPKVRASHILLRSRAEAETVMAKLKAGGNFAALAKSHSIDLPMALEGGSMGVIEKGRSLPEIEKALFLLKEGDVSEIVETRYGFHILTVNEIIGQKYKPFDEVKEEIRKFLIMEKEAKAFDQMASDLERTAVITVYENRLIEAASP